MPKPLHKLTDIWAERARRYGKRCVLDLSIPEEGFDAMTDMQRGHLLPLLKSQIHGREKSALDFGCGIGRFSYDIYRTVGVPVVAYDPCKELIDLAKPSPYIDYVTGSIHEFLALNRRWRFDVIWITLVLGGLQRPAVQDIADGLLKMLAPGGLVFFAEHTSDYLPGSDFWEFRPESYYLSLFKGVPTKRLGGYTTLGNEVSIFAGRKES